MYESNHIVPTAEYELELIKGAQAGCAASLETLCKLNVKLVWSVIRKTGLLPKWEEREDDIFQYGMIGLIRAIRKFDTERGMRLSTYSSHWIHQEVTRSAHKGEYASCFSTPPHHARTINILLAAARECDTELTTDNCVELYHRRFKDKEFSETTKLSDKQVVDSFKHLQLMIIDGDKTYEDGEGDETSSFWDCCQDTSCPDPAESVLATSAATFTNLVLQRIPTIKERDKKILMLRYGIGGSQPLTLEEVGEIVGMTRERVRQIQRECEKRIHGYLLRNGINKLSDCGV